MDDQTQKPAEETVEVNTDGDKTEVNVTPEAPVEPTAPVEGEATPAKGEGLEVNTNGGDAKVEVNEGDEKEGADAPAA